jgi:hypothetical protein
LRVICEHRARQKLSRLWCQQQTFAIPGQAGFGPPEGIAAQQKSKANPMNKYVGTTSAMPTGADSGRPFLCGLFSP